MIEVVYEDDDTPTEKRTERSQPKETESIDIADEDEPETDSQSYGIAKVLECRAADEHHVYLRIVWLYRPEDTEEGRQPWHSDNELFPSNHMQIVDAAACNGKVNVRHWTPGIDINEEDEKEFIWRQTLNTLRKQTFSSLETFCICDRPADLSSGHTMIQCTSASCGKLMHSSCIEASIADQALKDGISSIGGESSSTETKSEPSNPFEIVADGLRKSTSKLTESLMKMATRSTRATPANGEVNAETPHALKEKEEDSDLTVTVTDRGGGAALVVEVKDVKRQRKTLLPIHCLFCKEEVGAQKSGDGEGTDRQVSRGEDAGLAVKGEMEHGGAPEAEEGEEQ